MIFLSSYQVDFKIQEPKYYKITIGAPFKEKKMGSKFTPAQRQEIKEIVLEAIKEACLLYTSPSPRDAY